MYIILFLYIIVIDNQFNIIHNIDFDAIELKWKLNFKKF